MPASQHRSGLVRYLPPFEALKPYLTISTSKGKTTVSCSYKNFVQLIRRAIVDVPVNEPWYLERYPDIAEAIGQGIVLSPKSHFINDGYLVGREQRCRDEWRWTASDDRGELVTE
jgi:hypothetical protein